MSVQWYPGHMAKAKKEIEEKIKIVDIVYVLLDARVPLSSSNPMIGELLKNKNKLYILTKASMADKQQTVKWEEYFRKLNIPTVVVDSISGYNLKRIESISKDILKEKIQKDLLKGMKMRPIRAMIVGIPNVGKSTLINQLVNKKVALVGNKPGVTKAQQWIRLNQNFELLDTPGVLWPKFEDPNVGIKLALTGAVKDEVLKKEELIQYLLNFLNDNYQKMLIDKYQINLEEFNWIKFLESFLVKYNIKNEDYDRVYDIILNDFKNARIGKITLDRL